MGIIASSTQFVAASTIMRMCILNCESSPVTSDLMQTVQGPVQSMCTFLNGSLSCRVDTSDVSHFVIKKYHAKIIGSFDRCQRFDFYELILLQL